MIQPKGWLKHLLVFILAVGALLTVTGEVQSAQLTIKDIPDAYDDTYDTVGFEAASSGGDSFTVTGKEIVLIENTNGSPVEVSMNSQPDNLGRKNDLDEDVPANTIVMVGPMQREGWEATDGTIDFDYPDGNTGINIAIIRLKNQ